MAVVKYALVPVSVVMATGGCGPCTLGSLQANTLTVGDSVTAPQDVGVPTQELALGYIVGCI